MKKLVNRIMAGLLAALGFSTVGCGGENGRPQIVEYAPPLQWYNIKGKVTDASQPEAGIPGIRMIFGYPYVMNGVNAIYPRDTVYTAADGTYRYESDGGPLAVVLKDVDGEANGSFKSDTVDLSPFFAGAEWIDGVNTVVADLTLQPGQDPELTPIPFDE